MVITMVALGFSINAWLFYDQNIGYKNEEKGVTNTTGITSVINSHVTKHLQMT